jgi:formate hydrogenlyase subunit 6/NADH:ubiquinone oxidoreductase subunit I
VDVCPVNCIYEVGENAADPAQPFMFVIDPEECIDCGACEPACPVEAIANEDAVAAQSFEFIAINAMHLDHSSGNDGPAPERREPKGDIAQAAKRALERLDGGVISEQ